MPEKKKVLFICTGNTCRSPMAEGLFRKLVSEREDYEVLGSAGVSAYPGSKMSPETAAVLKDCAADDVVENFRSRPVDSEMLEQATHVFAMTESHLDILIHAFPDHAEKYNLVCDFISLNGQVGIDVPDPFGQGPKAYKTVAQVLGHALPTLLMFIDSELDDEIS